VKSKIGAIDSGLPKKGKKKGVKKLAKQLKKSLKQLDKLVNKFTTISNDLADKVAKIEERTAA
jgi:uncharacterized protein YoxC